MSSPITSQKFVLSTKHWIAVGIFIFGIGLGATGFYVERIQPIHDAEAIIKKHLVDPDNAKFKDMEIEDGKVCGSFNAKNSMGGYVGYKAFVIEKNGRRIWLDGDSTDDEKGIVSVSKCRVWLTYS